MSLYRREDSAYWWCRFRIGRQEIRRSTGATERQAAEEYEAALKTELWRQARLGEQPAYVWEDACLRWLQESAKRSLDKDREIIRWSRDHLEGWRLRAITPEVLRCMRDAKAEATSRATANRYMALVRAILNKAALWGWITAAPRVAMYRIERPDPRWITREEFERLAADLPPHAEAIARFAVATGLRMRAITGLCWSQVDLGRRCAWIPAGRAKGKRAIAVPLNAEARTVVRAQSGRHETYVFTYRGRPVDDVNTRAWAEAVKRAGVAPFRFHDLRHTWASWHVQNGTPLHVLKELGGWASMDMVLVYAHLSPGHLAEYAENTSRKRAQVNLNSAQKNSQKIGSSY